MWVGYPARPFSPDEVRAQYHAAVVKLKSLNGVDATDFADPARFSSPEVIGMFVRSRARTAGARLFSRFLIPGTLPPSYSDILYQRAILPWVGPGPAEAGDYPTSDRT